MRLLYLYEYAEALNFTSAVGPDVMEYDLRAKEILAGNLFPRHPDIHAPLYSLFLAALYWIGNGHIVLVRIVQLVLNFASWPALERLLDRKGVPEKIRLLFLAAAMLYPVPFFHQAELISESLLLPFITAVFWFLELADTEFNLRKRLLRMTGAGIAGGLAAITHPLSLAFAGITGVWYFCTGRKKEALCFTAGVLLLILPVITIKTLHYGQLTGIQQNGGFNFWLGNNTDATGGCYLRPGPRWRLLHKQAAEEAERRNISTDRVWLEKSAEFWLSHPLQAMGIYLKKAAMVFSPAELIAGADPGALLYRSKTIRYGAFLLPLLLFFSLSGIIHCFRHKEKYALPFFLLGAALYLAQILTVTSGRYRLAMLPALLFFAAYGAADFKWKKYFILPIIALAAGITLLIPHFEANKPDAAAILGEAALLNGNEKAAFRLLSFAKNGCNDPARISNQLGAMLERNRNFAGAEKFYLEAAKGDPDAMASFMNLANLYSRFPAKHALAEKYYRTAFAKSSGSALLHYNYAVFLNNTGRSAEAEKQLLQSLEYDNSSHIAYNLLGIIALNSGRRDAAIQCFKTASELAPSEKGYRKNLEFVRSLPAGNAAFSKSPK